MINPLHPLRILFQAVLYTLFLSFVWYFSTHPPYQRLEEDQAVLTIAFGHAGQPVRPCIVRTPEELEKLPPNMRNPMDCPRERSPVALEITLDGNTILEHSYQPPGLSKDGSVDVYRSLTIPAGKHKIVARMNDNVQVEGYNYEDEVELDIPPGKLLLVQFRTELDKFVFR